MDWIKITEINWAVFLMPVIFKAMSNVRMDEIGSTGEMSPLGTRQRLPRRERDV